MKVNPRSKDSFKLPKNFKDVRFKGEQRALKIRAGTIAKFNKKTNFGKAVDKKKTGHTIKYKKGKTTFKKDSVKGESSSPTLIDTKKKNLYSSQKKAKNKGSFLSQELNEEKHSFLSEGEKKSNKKKEQKDSEDKHNLANKGAYRKNQNKKRLEEKISIQENKAKLTNKESAKKGSLSASYTKTLKTAGTKQIIDKSFALFDQDEDTEGLRQFQNQAKNSEELLKGTKKVQRFVTKNEKFSRSVTAGKLDDLRFSSGKKVENVGKLANGSIKRTMTKKTGFSQATSNIRQTITKAVSKAVTSLTTGSPVGWIGASVLVVFVVFIGLLLMFSSQSNASTDSDGVIYVKHWDGKDAYHSSLLAQRYGITAEQIDSFIKSEGFTVDERATGKEFLRLQALSGIDVRMLVAFGQMESSFGTAGVAQEFPKANIFGYGAFDNDPNQGASWDNTRAVTEFRNTQIDSFGNRTVAIMDARASAYHNNTLKPGEFVYWTQLNAGKPRAEIAEKLDKWIDEHGGTPDPPGGYGPVGGGGGAGLANLDKVLGQVISGEFGGVTGQCYAVSAYYAHSINSQIILRNGVKASAIGSDYPWASWNWTVINNPKYKDIRAGDIINYAPGANMGTWNTDSYYGHTGVVGKVLGNNQYILYDQNPTPLKTWTVTFTEGSAASVVRPPK